MHKQTKIKNNEFIERWNDHVSDFNRLKYNLKKEELSTLEEIQNKMRKLIEKASKNRGKEVLSEWTDQKD